MAARNTYSKVVAWAKVILPLLALGLLSTLFLFSHAPDPNRAIPFAAVDVEELAREQRLGNARFAGTMADGREVILTADRAIPAQDDPNLIAVDGIEARLDLTEEEILLIVAGNGLLDTREQRADLGQEVQVTTSTGYHLVTDQLSVMMATSSAEAPGDVQVSGPGLDLTAGSMLVTSVDGSNVVLFNGGVRVLYQPRN